METGLLVCETVLECFNGREELFLDFNSKLELGEDANISNT